jgi:plasmid maintenance system antidote protein VapI
MNHASKGKAVPGLPLVDAIREAIRGCGLSMNALARLCAVSQPQLSRFVNGERTLTLPAAAKVCETLGLRLVGPEANAPRRKRS